MKRARSRLSDPKIKYESRYFGSKALQSQCHALLLNSVAFGIGCPKDQLLWKPSAIANLQDAKSRYQRELKTTTST